ncbi:MAG: ribulose-phosphate 3-epimerase [bacterium]
MVEIAPSILSADFSNLSEQILTVEQAGCELLHVDVMDGQFVENITFGPLIIDAINRITSLPLDVHLMITEPERHIRSMRDAGADMISIHVEAVSDPVSVLRQIRRLEEGLAYTFLEFFVYAENREFPEYIVHRREGDVTTRFRMVNFGNVYRLDCDKINTPQDAPLDSKVLQLSIEARCQLRDKISWYYGREPEEDRLEV